jgi:hypothetical protein
MRSAYLIGLIMALSVSVAMACGITRNRGTQVRSGEALTAVSAPRGEAGQPSAQKKEQQQRAAKRPDAAAVRASADQEGAEAFKSIVLRSVRRIVSRQIRSWLTNGKS